MCLSFLISLPYAGSRSRAPAARPLLTTDAASPGGNEVAQTREPCANTPRPGGESKTSRVHFTSA